MIFQKRTKYFLAVVAGGLFLSKVFAAPSKPSPSPSPIPIEDCNPEKSDEAQTRPAPVHIAQVLQDIQGMHDRQGRPLFNKVKAELEKEIRPLFEVDPSKISKLEQFYSLLFYLAKYKDLGDSKVVLNTQEARKLLLSSRVFSTPDFPNHLLEVDLFWQPHFGFATYAVKFDTPELDLALNKGEGFKSFKEGMCQIAKKLIFDPTFEFRASLTSNGHVFVDNFKGVDLYGQFGSRGIVKVDINYVSLKSIEFLKGSPFGIVKAKVSDREFQRNNHTWVLRMVSKMVTDKSTQPIDW
jgi:hypothetical protein